MSKSLLILGAGTFASEVEEIARLNGYDDIAFLDDNKNARCRPVIGAIDDAALFRNHYKQAIVALGDNTNRLKFHMKLKELGYSIPILVHPMSYISKDAQLLDGCIVRAMCVVGRYAKLGEANILNIGAKVDHDCIIGSGCHLLINSVVRNSSIVEPETLLKANRVIE